VSVLWCSTGQPRPDSPAASQLSTGEVGARGAARCAVQGRGQISRWTRVVCWLWGCEPAGPYEVLRRARLLGPGSRFGPFIIEAEDPDSLMLLRARKCARCSRWITR